MGVYDRFAIDGWASVNRWMYKAANFFDNFIVDNSVDLSGVSVKFLNVASRTVQSGKVQFYFMVLILAVSFYILKISF